jgi:hypothetical protein
MSYRRTLRTLVPLPVLAVVGILGMSTPAIAAGVSYCGSSFGTFSSSNFPSACWRPYGAGSPFNRQLPANPVVASDSSSIIANLAANHVSFEGGGSQFAFTSDDGRDGVYYSQPTDPLVTIHCTYQWGPGTCTGANGINIDSQHIHIPAGAQPQNNGSDMHMTVVDQANNLEYDFEHATWSTDHATLNVWSGAEIPNGPNLGTGLGGGGTASGIATLAGLITAPELAANSINHALAIVLPCTNGAVYPASLPDGLPCSQMTGESTTGTVAPIGTLFQLNMTDAQIATSGAPPWEQAIMTAMAHYGMYVNDTSDLNNIELEAESDISYTSLGGQPLLSNLIAHLGGYYYSPLSRWILTGTPIPTTKLRVINPCYAQGICTQSGTGKQLLARTAKLRRPSYRRVARHRSVHARTHASRHTKRHRSARGRTHRSTHTRAHRSTHTHAHRSRRHRRAGTVKR